MPMGKGKHPGPNTTYSSSVDKSGGGLSKDIEDRQPHYGKKGVFLPPKPKDDPTMFKREGDEAYMRRAADSLSSRSTKYMATIADPGPGYGKSKKK